MIGALLLLGAAYGLVLLVRDYVRGLRRHRLTGEFKMWPDDVPDKPDR